MKRPSASALAHAGAGVLATVTGMAAGHLVAALTEPAASPVLAVGSTVIDNTPTPVKEWAIREMGNADKPVLIGSVIAVTLLLAALAGVLARRRFALGAGLLLLLVAAAGTAALLRPAAEAGAVLPSVAAALVGVGALLWLVRALAPQRAHLPSGAAHPDSRGATRRGVLVAGGVLATAAAVMGGAGQWVIDLSKRIGDIVLPKPQQPIAALPTGLEEQYPEITAFRTPIDDFYRVDTNLVVPVVDHDSWELTIDGDVEREVTLTYDDLLKMPMIERDITMTCVSNEVGGTYVGAARWLGVPLNDVLALAGVGSKADQILSTAVDGFTISTPLEVATDGRDAMVVVGMNGEVLPRKNGFPARLITPGLYGYVGATKWLERLTLTTYDEQEAYWTEREWAIEGPIKIASRIDTPRPLATLDAGEQIIGGIAWAQDRGIGKVEVRIDGGAWQEAELGPDAGVDYWRQWFLPWDAAEGRHDLAVRATTEDGEVQTAVRAAPFPNGSSGLQEIVVTVS
ncbi:molybdopterin-dependent oxidoreductase [Nocardioides pacificus]